MRTISICSTKGGTGKSTLATALSVHVASESKRVALIDLDGAQESMSGWATLRFKKNLNGPDLIRARALSADLRRLGKRGYDFAIIDSPPTMDDGGILERAVDVADYILSPCRPSMFDICAAELIASLAGDTRLGFVLMDSTEEWVSVNRSAVKALSGIGHVFNARLVHRMAYVQAIVQGKTGPEIDAEARAEMTALWTEIRSWMK